MISKRLNKISSHIKGNRMADIGTDHGLVPIFLIEHKIVDYAIAADISKPSLQKAIDLAKEKNLELDARLGDGMEVLNPEDGIETVVIAGMGGVLIGEILSASEISKNVRLILQPMQGARELRKYLFENGYEIIDEDVVFEDDRYFEIIVAEYDGKIREVPNEIELKIPIKAFRKNQEEAFLYVEYLKGANLSIMKGLKQGKRALKRYIELKKEVNYYEKINDKYRKNN
ncbi:MAG: class I SAM-dependent methyltransferase [Peptoniphilus duerdenii]|uniref:tRNA (adenine(22)-N(1))-methyltransferase n=1 Tax=Peptoniphilus duerdenii TaxID=507750 RepID=UPI002550A5F0|nr:class I SAM-dependent methyltransferase [Peptoniphilus duerdenii]MDK8275671.1 class I SAM-dependent methyltransferase [Peptoniphilus duerdenii]